MTRPTKELFPHPPQHKILPTVSNTCLQTTPLRTVGGGAVAVSASELVACGVGGCWPPRSAPAEASPGAAEGRGGRLPPGNDAREGRKPRPFPSPVCEGAPLARAVFRRAEAGPWVRPRVSGRGSDRVRQGQEGQGWASVGHGMWGLCWCGSSPEPDPRGLGVPRVLTPPAAVVPSGE